MGRKKKKSGQKKSEPESSDPYYHNYGPSRWSQSSAGSSDERDESAAGTGCIYIGQLYKNLDDLNMEVRTDVPGDGNCFFHCVRDQQKRLGMEDSDPTYMRHKVTSFLGCLPEHDPLKPFVDDKYLEDAEKNGTWVDGVMIQATARVLGRDIHVVNSKPESSSKGYLMTKVLASHTDAKDPPLLMGQVAEKHFVSVDYRTW